jgi:hypothetical protein
MLCLEKKKKRVKKINKTLDFLKIKGESRLTK